jgi:hypothetical protein
MAAESITTATLGELSDLPCDRPIVAIRHDIDSRLESAVELARLENERGIRATYFVLHTASYYDNRERLLEALRLLQDSYGHEIGWHNDLVTLQCVHRIEPISYLRRELDWLRRSGIRVVGVAAHGSPHCHRLGYHNGYIFEGTTAFPGFPHREIVPTAAGPCQIHKIRMEDVGLEYDAYAIPNVRYYSDSSFDARGRRWHPCAIELVSLSPGERVVVLIHPCHWDRGAISKWSRLAKRIRTRMLGRTFRREFGFALSRPSPSCRGTCLSTARP